MPKGQQRSNREKKKPKQPKKPLPPTLPGRKPERLEPAAKQAIVAGNARRLLKLNP